MNLADVLVGGLIGVLGTLLASRIQEERQAKREARNLARAFRGEIVALREIVRRRHYSELLEMAIEQMRTSGQVCALQIPIRRGYFAIFNSNAERLGHLDGKFPEDIARFYVQANSALEDIASINEGLFNNSVANAIQAFEELKSLIDESSVLADKIALEISVRYPE